MNKRWTKKKTWVWVVVLTLWLVPFALGILFGDMTVSQRLTSLLIFIVICLAISFFLLNNYFRKSLGRAMQGSTSRVYEEPEAVRLRSPSAPPFDYQVFDRQSVIEIDPAAAGLLRRGYRHYRTNIYGLIAGALYLSAAFSIGVLVRPLLLDGYSIPTAFCCGIVVAFPVALLIANPNRYPTFWTTWIWRAWNILLLFPIAFTAIESAIETFRLGGGALLLFVLATAVLAGYGVLMTAATAILRREVASHKPLRLLTLWVFNFTGNLATPMSTFGLIWQFLGSTQYLRGGGYTVNIGAVLGKKEASRLADTPEELESALRDFHYLPTWSGRYKINSVLCGDAVWKPALHALLHDSDVVVMSLIGFSPSNQGCLYELGLLVDRLPMQRVLFLIDSTTDLDFLIDTLRQSWETMVVDSPNHMGPASPIRIFRLSLQFSLPVLEGIDSMTADRALEIDPNVKASDLLSNPQKWAAQEVDNMLRLILQGAVPASQSGIIAP